MDTAKAADLSLQTAIWALTPKGIHLGMRLCKSIDNADLFLPRKEKSTISSSPNVPYRQFENLSDELSLRFRKYPAHIFIFSTGIGVRLIAPLIESKTCDPAVVVVDELGYHAISLLSGHIGGANALAQRVARIIGSVPVITTATDLNGLPSVDLLAKELNLVIETPQNIKHVNTKLLKQLPISVVDPENLIVSKFEGFKRIGKIEAGHADLLCSYETVPVSRETLILRPKSLVLGIGCNRGTDVAEILTLLTQVFASYAISKRSVLKIATIDIKKDEDGIIQTAKALDCPLEFYEKELLNQVEGVQTHSKMAEKHIGVKSVCEAAAIQGAHQGPLIITKQKTRNVTLAVAVIK